MILKRIPTAVLVLFLLHPLNLYCEDYYIAMEGSNTTGDGSPEAPWATLKKGFSEMVGGDTLFIKDGIYTGEDNRISSIGTDILPPSGTPGAYTKVKAENEGSVTFDGAGTHWPFYLGSGCSLSYVEFHGLKWIDPPLVDPGMLGRNPVAITYGSTVHHVKFFRCGAAILHDDPDTSATWAIRSGEYLLFEECYSWGRGRYGFMIQDLYSGDGAKKVVLRRCVVRIDDVTTDMPISAFQSYCAQEIELQNCIAIDINTSYWRNWSYSGAGFSMRRHEGRYGYANDIHYRGCIALNFLGWTLGYGSGDSYFSGFQLGAEGPVANSVENSIAWNVMKGITRVSRGQVVHSNINKISIMAASNPDYNPDDSSTGSYGINLDPGWGIDPVWTVNNSIVIGGDRYSLYKVVSDYNVIFNDNEDFRPGTTAGVNDFCDDNTNEIDPLDGDPGNGVPALRHIVRVENNSDLSGAANDGGNIGATVMKRIGVSGTLWGDAGYAVTTDENLWPFPYEEQIKKDFSTYNPGGVNPEKPDGNRGFCAEGNGLYGGPITLTSYIWEYLGNPVPAEIYGSQSELHDLDSDNDVDGIDLSLHIDKINQGTSTISTQSFADNFGQNN